MEQINFEEMLDNAFKKNLEKSIYEIKSAKTVTLEVMREVWNKAIEASADNAELAECDHMEFYINKNSILKLKV